MQAAVLGTFVLACIAAAQRPVSINGLVDKQLEEHNRMLTPKYGVTPIGKLTIGGIELSSGVEIGLNTLSRTGDCFAVKRSNTVSYKYRVGFRLLAFAFGSVKIGGKAAPGIFSIDKNSLDIDFTVHNEAKCRVTLEKFEFTEFSDVKLRSPEPDIDNIDVEKYIVGSLLADINVILGKAKKGFEHHLQAMCHIPRPLGD